MSCFFFNDTATTEIYTLSLHDALPILPDPARAYGADHRVNHVAAALRAEEARAPLRDREILAVALGLLAGVDIDDVPARSEEHTSELQSRQYLVCRLLLEKKNKQTNIL